MKRKPFFQVHPISPFKVDYSLDTATEALTTHLYKRIMNYGPFQELVIFCIGTDRSTGDSLGPLVGSQLQKMYPSGMHVYGTIDEPVHAVNLAETIEKVETKHPKSLIIAVDACLGQFNSVGQIQVADGPLKPGAGVKKELPEIGTFHITGIVNIGGFMEYFVLQNTRLSIVMKMADMIAHSLFHSTNLYLRDQRKSSTAF